MTKFGVCLWDYDKIKRITMKFYSDKRKKSVDCVDSVEPVDSVEDPITVSEVLGTRSLAGEEAVAVTFLFPQVLPLFFFFLFLQPVFLFS